MRRRCTFGRPARPPVFLVPTQLKPSSIHGTGVFAVTAIAAGTRLWEFTEGVDWRIEAETMAAFPEPFQSRLRAWSYLDTDGRYVLCGDTAKFMNHSDAPNCDEPDGATVANRDIAAGEELTCDYRTFDAESQRKGETFDPALS